MRWVWGIVIVGILALGAVAYILFFQNNTENVAQNFYATSTGNMVIKSPSFKEGDVVPAKYTCEGDNVNPPLEIRATPHEAKSLVLIVDDPDATSGGVWDHWVVWNIKSSTQYIEEDTIPQGSVEGKTSFGSNRYGGPCPPQGNEAHHYRFKIYALDMVLDIPASSGRVEVEKAMEGHTLDSATLIGLYARK